MRVAFDVSYIQHRCGGIGRYSLTLLRSLLRAQRSPRFILHGWSLSLNEPLLRTLESESVRLSIARIPGNVKRLYWDRVRMPSIGSLIGDFDLFHSMDPFAPPAGRRPVVVTVYDLVSRSHPAFHTKQVAARDAGIPASLGRAAAVVVPSEYTRAELIGSGLIDPSLIHVAPPTIPELFTEVRQPADDALLGSLGIRSPYLLFAGTIEPRKNVPGLLRAFEALCDRGSMPDLVLAGKMGWMSGQVLPYIQSSRHAARIRHLDYVTDGTLAALYRNALCFIYPSFVEGYGLPVAEAMASGVPVITSNSSGMAEIAGEGAMLIDPHSHESLMEALDGMIASAATRESFRARGLRQAAVLRAGNGAEIVSRLYVKLGGS